MIADHEREARERLARYGARPAVAHDRLSWTSNGRISYKRKRPWPDGTCDAGKPPRAQPAADRCRPRPARQRHQHLLREVLFAAIGSAQRKDLTILGDVVYTATLLEEATKELETPIVVSDSLATALPPDRRATLVSLGEVMLKGKSQPVAVLGAMDTARR